MNANATTAPAKTFDITAREKRIQVLAHRDATKGNMKALTGNTWPLKSMLYAYGSLWNKEAKALEVPEHVHAECQAAIDSYAASHQKLKVAKPVNTAPAVKSQPQPKAERKARPAPEAKPQPEAAPATGISTDAFCRRIANLGAITDQVVKDLLANGQTDAAAELVKGLTGFNLAHKALVR